MTTADNSSAAADWISVGMASGENPTNQGKSKEKALFAAVANKALFSEVDGARTRNHRIDSPVNHNCNALPNKDLRQQETPLVPVLVPANRKQNENRGAETLTSNPEVKPGTTDFAAALAMIAGLPLSDREKAEAVRRLLAKGD